MTVGQRGILSAQTRKEDLTATASLATDSMELFVKVTAKAPFLVQEDSN